MARLTYGLLQSLDGYVSGVEGGPELPMPGDTLNAYFSQQLRQVTGSLYGRRMYEIMRYWDKDEAEQDPAGREFAMAWRAKPKWVVSRTLKSVGPNATLVSEDMAGFVRRLKAEHEGEIEVAGPELAASLSALGLIDEYHLYVRAVVLGGGKPFFAGPVPPLRFVAAEELGEDCVKLVYAPA
ncbi:MAG: dihydrofolate reductase [Hyphomicrobiales bacterium]|nr:MAG: dihydrofolate reductase [Hyphomicrobiales bacterium]